MSSTLKAELKAWEAHFRETHNGANPSKSDIKADAAIAAKYKLYSKSKAPVEAAPASSSSSKNSRAVSPSPAPPAAISPIFKTPTKPRPSSSRPPSASTSVSTSLVSNSPSKLRTLAGAHSVFGSPNKKTRRVADEDPFAPPPPPSLLKSPKRYNPFSAPRREDNFFGAPAPPLVKKPSGTGTRRGSSTSSIGGGSAAWKEVEKMEVDSQAVDSDDEILGPSPVKPTKAGRTFKPLLEDNPFASSQSGPSSSQTMEKKLFESDFVRALAASSSKGEKSTSGKEKEKKRKGGKVVESDTEEERDAFVEPAPSNGKAKGKGKAKEASKASSVATTKRRAKKPKFTHPANGAATEDEVEMDEEGLETQASIQRRQKKGVFILDVDDSEEEEVESGRKEKVVVGPRRVAVQEGKDDLGGDAPLLYRERRDMLSSKDAVHASIHSDDEDLDADDPNAAPPPYTEIVHISPSIPSSLLNLLSLRTSPLKSATAREREREASVRRLLQEPSFVKEQGRKGLEDLVDGDGNEDDGSMGFEGDDDWDSENEGWKKEGAGEWMDGMDEVLE